MGKKSQKIHTRAEEEERNQCAINNRRSYRSTIAYRGSTQSQVTLNARKSTNSWYWYQHSRSLWCAKWFDSSKPRKIRQVYGF